MSDLTKRQISAICCKNGSECRYSKVPPRECGVDLRIPRQPRYRNGNQVEILHNGKWHILGWLWNIEMYSEEQITAMLVQIKEASLLSDKCHVYRVQDEVTVFVWKEEGMAFGVHNILSTCDCEDRESEEGL